MALTQINKAGLDDIALDHVFTIGASGSSAYTFQGEGLNGTVNNPTLYLTRGKTYRFENGSGGHPIRIQSTSGASGTAYNTGVTNNAGSGTVIVEVQHDAPDVLYYQCTSHAAMNGILYITGALADGGVTTAKIADDAVTDAKLANSINSAIAANTAKVQTTINNNADNRVITGSGTANTLNGESNLTYDGTHLNIGASSVTEGEITGRIHRGDNNGNQIQFTSANTGTGNSDGLRVGWNGAQGQMFLYENAAMRFATNATERMRIDSSGNVGINGTPNSNFKLDVNGAARIGNTTDGIIIENSTSNAAVNNACRIHRHGATGNLHITAGTSTARNMIFATKTNGGEIARFTDTGLCFNGDTAAANALDDYEEGGFTPTYDGTWNNVSNSNLRHAKYTKIGNTVHVWMEYFMTNNNGGFTNSANIRNFPYAGPNSLYAPASLGLMYGPSTYPMDSTSAGRCYFDCGDDRLYFRMGTFSGLRHIWIQFTYPTS